MDLDFDWLAMKLRCGASQTRARGLLWQDDIWGVVYDKRNKIWVVADGSKGIFPTAIFLIAHAGHMFGDQYTDMRAILDLPLNTLLAIQNGLGSSSNTIRYTGDSLNAFRSARAVRNDNKDLFTP